jgi:phosphoribosylaminoimidazole carboxylase PurE protein
MSEREPNLRVGVIMGSDSDLSTMIHVGRALQKFNLEETIDYEERIVSAHRTPEWRSRYAKSAENRGLKVIIAGAGGSAALPGDTASETILPVLGVAITKNPEVMNRALGSTIGMPEGKPLAVFQGEQGAFNAGLFAVRIMALFDPELRQAYTQYEAVMASDVMSKDSTLKQIGAVEYLRVNSPKTK